MEFLCRLGEALRERRLKLGMSQEGLAQCSGVHRTYISDLERGTRNVTVLTLARIAECLDVPVSRLVKKADPNERNGRAIRPKNKVRK